MRTFRTWILTLSRCLHEAVLSPINCLNSLTGDKLVPVIQTSLEVQCCKAWSRPTFPQYRIAAVEILGRILPRIPEGQADAISHSPPQISCNGPEDQGAQEAQGCPKLRAM